MARVSPQHRYRPPTPERTQVLLANPARGRLLERIINATTLAQIAAAREAQRQWLLANPDDFGVLEAGKTLAYAETALLGEEMPDGSRAPLTGRDAA